MAVIHLRSRYYFPEFGRFINADNILNNSLEANIYSYTRNNPTNGIDPSGKYTIAFGYDAEAAYIFKIGFSQAFVMDGHGNLGLITSTSGGGGSPLASIGGTLAVTNADTIFDLQGIGLSIGVSFTAGVDALAGKAKSGAAVVGAQVSLSISTPYPEVHGQLVYTEVVSLNWLPAFLKKG